MSQIHILSGLEPDNLLAFMALLGFHRAVDHAAPEWGARLKWTGAPLRPCMVLSTQIDRAVLLEAAARGCNALAGVHEFDRPDLNYSGDEARAQLKDACERSSPEDLLRVDLVAALMSDAALKDNRVRATPFCAMFGQGHQHFLDRLGSVPRGVPPKECSLTQLDLNSAAMLERALFQQWEYHDPTESFRWDPLEDRRYALRYRNPSNEKGQSVHGANRLASLGLPLLSAVPKRERGEVRLYAIGTSWEAGSGTCVQWPVWSRAATLSSVVKLLASGLLEGFGGLGVLDIYRSERISVGKFVSFTRAVPIRQA